MNFHGSYHPDDVLFLLKPSIIKTIDIEEKEKLIQSGKRHYSEMLSEESVPDKRYMDLYFSALARNASRLKRDVISLSNLLVETFGPKITLVSLARAGTPIGVLMHRYLRSKGHDSRHYSVSIIRDRGIDHNALRTIAGERDKNTIVFVDGWTGKGAIRNELDKTLENTGIKPNLAVIADPAGKASFAATFEDYLIPSGILNGIVSGLVSRTVLNEDVTENDYHACLYQENMKPFDQTLEFIRYVESAANVPSRDEWKRENIEKAKTASTGAVDYVKNLHGVEDLNRVKPGIAEATRAILRRVPDAIHVKDKSDVDTAHIVHLAENHGIPVLGLPDDCPYRAVTVIKRLSE